MLSIKDPSFVAYCITVIVMSLQLTLLDSFAGLRRARSRTVVNPEDAKTVAKGAKVVENDPPDVARVMRAHRNLLANTVPFLFLGLVWMFLSPSFQWTTLLFGTFATARLFYSISYINNAQPWRTVFFVVGQLAMVGVMLQIIGAIAL